MAANRAASSDATYSDSTLVAQREFKVGDLVSHAYYCSHFGIIVRIRGIFYDVEWLKGNKDFKMENGGYFEKNLRHYYVLDGNTNRDSEEPQKEAK